MIKSFRAILPITPMSRSSTEPRRNPEGLTYAEWLAAARFGKKSIPVGAIVAWKAGEDPIEYAGGK